ncbi:MAG TPA: hypothetical protein VHY09_03400 [Candidatus Methylacidiphilales bacterium]|jgi:hypothetical protein|nr:hypothetical protein [Candidatus Methylacidiphilales bacterium]
MPLPEQVNSFADLQRALSAKRLESYRPPGASNEKTVQMYLWNAAISEALFPMLQQLEVAFRNTLHQSIGTAWNDSHWLMNGLSILDLREVEKVRDSKLSLQRQMKPVTEDDLVGELSFGFWTSLTDSRYDRHWPRFIKNAFPHCINSMRTRDEISSRANKLRKLRNAVFHHHSIWHWSNLEQHHRDGFALISWISPELTRITKAQDRFPGIFAARP